MNIDTNLNLLDLIFLISSEYNLQFPFSLWPLEIPLLARIYLSILAERERQREGYYICLCIADFMFQKLLSSVEIYITLNVIL